MLAGSQAHSRGKADCAIALTRYQPVGWLMAWIFSKELRTTRTLGAILCDSE
jgi:hypothetical protein